MKTKAMPRARNQSRARVMASRQFCQFASPTEPAAPGEVLARAVVRIEEPAVLARRTTDSDGETRARRTALAASHRRAWSGTRSGRRTSARGRPDKPASDGHVPSSAGNAASSRFSAAGIGAVDAGEVRRERQADDGRGRRRRSRGWQRCASEPEIDERVIGARRDLQDRRDEDQRSAPATAAASSAPRRAPPPSPDHASARARGTSGVEPTIPAASASQELRRQVPRHRQRRRRARAEPGHRRQEADGAGQRVGAEEHPADHDDDQHIGVPEDRPRDARPDRSVRRDRGLEPSASRLTSATAR